MRYKGDILVYKDESYRLNGILFTIHNELGRFAKEKQYSDALERKFNELNIEYVRENTIGYTGNRIDYKVFGRIIIELKAKEFLLKEDFNQLKRYLDITGCKLGILVNFRSKYLRPRRVLNLYVNDFIPNW